MSYITQKEYEAWIGGWSWIEKVSKKFAEDYVAKYDPKSFISEVDVNPDDEDISAGDIEIATEYYCCGSVDYATYLVPISYLWDEDWVAKEEAKREDARLNREEEDRKTKEADEKERKEQRYKQYLALKKEYEK